MKEVSIEELTEMKKQRRKLQGQIFRLMKKESDPNVIRVLQQQVWELEDEITNIEEFGVRVV